jgi:hypothetical protein
MSYIGVYTIINYSSQIFKDAGGSLSPNESSIILGCEQLVGSYIAILLIEKLGRKVYFLINFCMVYILQFFNNFLAAINHIFRSCGNKYGNICIFLVF